MTSVASLSLSSSLFGLISCSQPISFGLAEDREYGWGAMRTKKQTGVCGFLAGVLVPCECVSACVSVFVHGLPQCRRSHVFDRFSLLITAVIGCRSACCTPVCLPVCVVRLPVLFVKSMSFISPGVLPNQPVLTAQKHSTVQLLLNVFERALLI